MSGFHLTLQHSWPWSAFETYCRARYFISINIVLLSMLFSFILKQAWKHWRVCVSEGEGKEGVHILQGARGGSRQCKSLPVCHLTPAGVMLWHIGKWGERVDEDFNRILKRVMVAFMCVIVTYPKVTALKRHHPSPACLPHASFCLTDSLKLCLFVCSQSHFHLWRSRAKRGDDCTLGGAVLGRTRGVSSF